MRRPSPVPATADPSNNISHSTQPGSTQQPVPGLQDQHEQGSFSDVIDLNHAHEGHDAVCLTGDISDAYEDGVSDTPQSATAWATHSDRESGTPQQGCDQGAGSEGAGGASYVARAFNTDVDILASASTGAQGSEAVGAQATSAVSTVDARAVRDQVLREVLIALLGPRAAHVNHYQLDVQVSAVLHTHTHTHTHTHICAHMQNNLPLRGIQFGLARGLHWISRCRAIVVCHVQTVKDVSGQAAKRAVEEALREAAVAHTQAMQVAVQVRGGTPTHTHARARLA